MSELTDIIFNLSKQFKVTIRPRSLVEYREFAEKIKEDCKKLNIFDNLYVYYFIKEHYPYLTCKDMADILELSKSNYSKKKDKWDFEIKTYDDVKANIEMLRNKI